MRLPISPQWNGLMPPDVQLNTTAVLGLRGEREEGHHEAKNNTSACILLACMRPNPQSTDLRSPVYQPAASVRLMTTSTGMRSATASLLALMKNRNNRKEEEKNKRKKEKKEKEKNRKDEE
ncbi:hypothetical protein EYF80_026661 [Liparis tanakae]|uniref:Uncharacterized protein n=1 Tax=Liparis tanakae TaxID=230148 RepID=A0A4Z2HBC7_9TELE|nr:hypothetical protein EYF80_026661 [Liparis tanakae]